MIAPATHDPADIRDKDIRALVYAAQMYGLQTDQVAELLGTSRRQAGAAVARWVRQGLAQTAVLGPGAPWVWLTATGLRACGVRYSYARPALSRLAHIRAVAATRLAMEAVALYRDSGAYWGSERELRARTGRIGAREHLPDAEVHWPDLPADGPAPPWAGECWAVEVELTAKTLTRTTAIMRELLARTGDYGCPAAQVSVPGHAPRHTRALYLCSPAATATVLRARESLGPLAERVEVHDLPASAYLREPG